MARLEPLIRYRQHIVDEKRRALAELLARVDKLLQQKMALMMALAQEQAAVTGLTDIRAQGDLARFAAAIQDKCTQIDGEMGKLNARIAMAQEDVRAAFAEMKKIEITDRERKKTTKKALEAKDAGELDAIGIEGFQRKKTEEER